jgi:hypothetical protein
MNATYAGLFLSWRGPISFMMKHRLFLLALSLGCLWTSAQSVDSTGTGRKPSLREMRQQQLIRMLNRRQREMFESRQERMAEIEARPYRKADSAKWSLSLNPFGVLELQSALGMGIGYQFNPHWQVWLESSGLFQLYNKPAQSCLGGIREILAVKYYFGPRQSLFFAGEFRYKDVFFHDVANFNDNFNNIPVYHYTYKVEDVIFGGAAWLGGLIRLSNNHRWRLEPSIGLGFKGRTVVWHNVPSGYTYQKPVDHLELIPNPVRTPERLTVYLPATVRLVYVL